MCSRIILFTVLLQKAGSIGFYAMYPSGPEPEGSESCKWAGMPSDTKGMPLPLTGGGGGGGEGCGCEGGSAYTLKATTVTNIVTMTAPSMCTLLRKCHPKSAHP